MSRFSKVPPCLTLGLASLIAFYRGDHMEDSALIGTRPAGNAYPIRDDGSVLAFFLAHRDDAPDALVHHVLTNIDFWGEDLTQLAGLEEAVLAGVNTILTEGAYKAMQDVL